MKKTPKWRREEAKLKRLAWAICAKLPKLKVGDGLTVHFFDLEIDPDHPKVVAGAVEELGRWLKQRKLKVYVRHDAPMWPTVEHAIAVETEGACLQIRQGFSTRKNEMITVLALYGR